MSRRHGAVLFLALFLLLGAAARWRQTSYGLPAVRHPDSAKTVDVALRLAGAWRGGHATVDPGTYQYPTLYSNALALAYLTVGSNGRAEETGRRFTAMAGLAGAVAAFLLAWRLGGPASASAAAAFLAFGFLFLRQGFEPNPDALQCTLTLGALAALLWSPSPGRRALALSGALAGLAAGTKYTALIFLFPALAVVLIARGRPGRWRGALVWTVAAGLGFLVSTPAFLLKPAAFLGRLAVESQIQHSGGFEAGRVRWWDYLVPAEPVSHPVFANSIQGSLGWPFLIAALVAVVWMAVAGSRRRDARSVALVASALAPLIFFSAVSRIHAIRFILPSVAVLAVLISLALGDAGAALSAALGRWRRHRESPAVVVALGAALLLAPSVARWANFERLLALPDTREEAAVWMFQNVPPGARVLNFLYGPALPAGRYDVKQWLMPEYVVELKHDAARPSFDRLEADGIEWVIWNGFYTRRFGVASPLPEVARYSEGWQVFLETLSARAADAVPFPSHSPLAPDLVIFRLARAPPR
jgi:4-amino-4-deoxy-L-arabinose transferase-like glycosyltransferase